MVSLDEPDKRVYTEALRLLTYKPRTVSELRRKLRSKGHAAAAVSRTVARLEEIGYLNDEAYARAWSEHAVRIRRLGAVRIEAELIRRGIERQLACRAAREAVDEKDESRLADEVIMARMRRGGSGPWDARTQKRLVAFLLRKGFTRGAAYGALKRYKHNVSIG